MSHSSCCYMLLLGMQDEIWSEMAGDRRCMTFEKLDRNRHPRGRCPLLLSLQVNEPRQQHPPPEPQSGMGVAAPTSSAGSAANVSSRSADGLGLDSAELPLMMCAAEFYASLPTERDLDHAAPSTIPQPPQVAGQREG